MSFKPRYILAEEAEERIVALYRKERGDAAEIFNTAIDACQNIILDMYDNAPAEVEPVKRGKWRWDDEGYHCSECFYHAYGDTGEILSGNWHYCPNCGAFMENGEEA